MSQKSSLPQVTRFVSRPLMPDTFPMDRPRYLIMVMLDDPKAIPGTYGFATAGWNAVPTAANIVERIAPMLGITPVFTDEEIAKLGISEQKKRD